MTISSPSALCRSTPEAGSNSHLTISPREHGKGFKRIAQVDECTKAQIIEARAADQFLSALTDCNFMRVMFDQITTRGLNDLQLEQIKRVAADTQSVLAGHQL